MTVTGSGDCLLARTHLQLTNFLSLLILHKGLRDLWVRGYEIGVSTLDGCLWSFVDERGIARSLLGLPN